MRRPPPDPVGVVCAPRGAAGDATAVPTARVGPGFVSLYTLSFAGGSLVLIAPLLVTLALKVNDLVGVDRAARNLALVTGVGSLLSMVSNPFFGRLSDRTTARLGMRRPWMLVGLAGGTVGTVTVALAPSIPVVLVGWCTTQVFFNALLAAQVAVLPDQVPETQRGIVSGVLGICLPVASVVGTYLVQAFNGAEVAMFLAPCVRRRRVRGRVRRRGSTTGVSTPPTGRRGHCARSPGPSTSTRAATRTSRGRSPAGSWWCWRTPSSSPTRPTT